jgi:class 3 adenylate cyclase/pimeloyl-ACP methyl ester carboxylesterase
MTPPPVQYVKTSDGVSIAYTTAGSGPPLIWIQTLPSHIQMEWEQPILRAGFETIIGAGMTLVRFDFRGTGLSAREASDVSAAAFVRDIEAVVGRLGLDRFAVLAVEFAATMVIEYAALHPDQVSRLILMNPGTQAIKDVLAQTRRGQTVLAMVDDWEMFTENVPAVALGFGYEEARRYAAFFRASIEQEMAMRFISESVDHLNSAGKVKAPTLVIRHTGLKWLSMESTRELVSAIPNASMVAIEGGYTDHPRETGRAMLGFLAGYAPPRPERATTEQRPAPGGPSGTAVILFADIAESTSLTERLGDSAFREKARELDGTLRGVIREHSGTAIEGKLLGDGVLAVFTSARNAIGAALSCGRAGGDAGLPLHLGLHAGDVIREDNNVYGGAVNIASRISGLSASGEVLVSDTVRSLARTSAEVCFEDRGEQPLKGVGEAVRVWAVREAE